MHVRCTMAFVYGVITEIFRRKKEMKQMFIVGKVNFGKKRKKYVC